MTEDEAKTKWCPQAMSTLASAAHMPSANRLHFADGEVDTVKGTRCLGSGCMAWRWTSSQHGYCGLAGRPKA